MEVNPGNKNILERLFPKVQFDNKPYKYISDYVRPQSAKAYADSVAMDGIFRRMWKKDKLDDRTYYKTPKNASNITIILEIGSMRTVNAVSILNQDADCCKYASAIG